MISKVPDFLRCKDEKIREIENKMNEVELRHLQSLTDELYPLRLELREYLASSGMTTRELKREIKKYCRRYNPVNSNMSGRAHAKLLYNSVMEIKNQKV